MQKCRQCLALEDQVYDLRMRVRELLPELPPLPACSGQMSAMAGYLLQHRRATHKALTDISARLGHNERTTPESVKVQAWRLKHWFKRWGIDMINLHGHGYRLEPRETAQWLLERWKADPDWLVEEAKRRRCHEVKHRKGKRVATVAALTAAYLRDNVQCE